MERLTSNKPTPDMNMFELAHNSCYADEKRNARYRDCELDIDSRELVRSLVKDMCNEDLSDMSDEEFDEYMAEMLSVEVDSRIGLLALFYRNLWAMADLREKLKEYEDLEEQGRLLRLPCKEVFCSSGDEVYYIFDNEIVECIHCGLFVDFEGKLWISLACNEDIFPYRSPDAEHDLDPTDWCKNTTEVLVNEFGKTVFLTKSEAEAKLKELRGGENE